MNTCECFSESFSEYVENGVRPEQKKSLDAHLAQCPSCHAAVARLQNLRSHMRALPRIKTSPDFETLLRTRLMLERKRAYAIPFFSEFARMPRAATYAFAGLMLVLTAALLIRGGQGAEALAKRAQNDDVYISSFAQPAAESSPSSAKIFYLLDKISPASLRTHRDLGSAHERATPPDSSAVSQTNPTGPQQKTATF
jgi:anti-sigma factor RsiW